MRDRSQKKREAQLLKEAIIRTFNELQQPNDQGENQPFSLIEWARSNPEKFYTSVMTRLLPKPVELSAQDGAQFMLVYQVGKQQIAVGQDGQLQLPDPDVVDAEVLPADEAEGRGSGDADE